VKNTEGCYFIDYQHFKAVFGRQRRQKIVRIVSELTHEHRACLAAGRHTPSGQDIVAAGLP
jgi:hypothetical protein